LACAIDATAGEAWPVVIVHACCRGGHDAKDRQGLPGRITRIMLMKMPRHLHALHLEGCDEGVHTAAAPARNCSATLPVT
jgi:hypothetical protein